MRIETAFVTSAAAAADFPPPGLAEVALVGRSNVGKSSLINALGRRRLARTSAAPGKTRLANFYRVGGGGVSLHLIDLPGYGYARGDAAGFDALVRAVFDRGVSALLVVDIRHPGLEADLAAWRWMQGMAEAAVVATKADKLARGQRIRALRELESVFDSAVLPTSAATGEGLDNLWKLIDRLANSRPTSSRPPRSPSRHRPRPRRATGRPRRSNASIWRRSKT